jgi:hypothetical protein
VDFNKLRLGELLAGAAGILLLIVMIFFPWYGLGGLEDAIGGVASVDTSINALQAFGLLDILLFLTVVAAIGAAVLAGTQSSVALPVAASVVVTALGVLVTLLVLYRIVNTPGYGGLLDPSFGAFLGLLLCAAIALGGFLSMRDEGTSFGQAASGLRTSSADPPTRPAPPAGPTPPAQAPPASPPPADPPPGQQPPPSGPPPA